MENLLFTIEEMSLVNDWYITDFSADDTYPQEFRRKIEDRYWPITEITDKFNRQSVSYQLNKKDRLHRWLKYKEGFSSELVKLLLKDFRLKEGDVVLDPFMGSGTTALVSILSGYNSVGFDILPMSAISIKAKSSVLEYDIDELTKILEEIKSLDVPKEYKRETPVISITQDGYPENTSRELAFYKEHFNMSPYSETAKTLLTLCTLNTLERISYSAKDGQYLRWDYRCPKIIAAAEDRKKKGRKPFVVKLDKGVLPSLKEALSEEICQVIEDIKLLQGMNTLKIDRSCNFIEGSSLFELPKMSNNSINAVISSPPYCNRYDYTRTYAMELAYLGVTEDGIRRLRQDLLSCTVENKSKLKLLKDYYDQIGFPERYAHYASIIRENEVLHEIMYALRQRNANGEINNKGVIQMIEGYFTELGFLFGELYRVCKKGAYVAFVNDNVRYAGEVIPVDYLTTNIAERLGFKPIVIYTLKQKKGNSSQQMKKYGRVALRKSITVWQKP